jgi:hypothetical protein
LIKAATSLFSDRRHLGEEIFYGGILLLAASLPLSKFGMSLAQFFMAGGWLISGNVSLKLKRVARQPIVWALWWVFFVHIFSLTYTTDINEGLSDLRIKLPLLLLPLFFASVQPLSGKRYRIVLAVLIGATVISTLASLGYYLGILKANINDIRDVSRFISHIRLSLLVCFSFVGLIWFFRTEERNYLRILQLAAMAWLLCFLILMESLTGLGILLGGIIVFSLRQMIVGNSMWAKSLALISIVVFVVLGYKVSRFVFIESVEPIAVQSDTLPAYTRLGHPYKHDTARQDLENGNAVWLYVNEQELDSAWNTRSSINMYSADRKGHMLQMTLMRYLSSLGYPKDAEGVLKLTSEQVRDIENGVANPDDKRLSNLPARIRKIAWEYRIYYFGGDPSGHSLTQRIEYWKTAWHLIRKEPLFGYGSGDIKLEYNQAYKEMGSKLEERWRLLSHNQYLRIGVALGLFGFVVFMFSLVFPWFYQHKYGDLLYSAFLFIALSSMLTEDTLETQAGVTFFAFLNSFFLFNDARTARYQ